MTRGEVNFINKYVLTDEDYLSDWSAVQERIFSISKDAHNPIWLPERVFSIEYNYNVFLPGGFLIDADYLENLKSFLSGLSELVFVMIENDWIKNSYKGPHFIFPASITWEEYKSGGAIVEPLITSFDRDYYIFGKTDRWGLYLSSGLDLIVAGFKDEATAIEFNKCFNINEDVHQGLEDILDYLKKSEPEIYNKLLTNYTQFLSAPR